MAQHDYVIDNASGATVRADINSALSAIQTLNSGTSAPSSTAAGMLWLDTTGGAPYALKVRDAGDNHWLTLASVTDPGSDGNIETSATIKGTIDSSATFPYDGTTDAGRIIQIKSSTSQETNDLTTTDTARWNYSITLKSSTSKVLVFHTENFYQTSDNGYGVKIYRDDSVINDSVTTVPTGTNSALVYDTGTANATGPHAFYGDSSYYLISPLNFIDDVSSNFNAGDTVYYGHFYRKYVGGGTVQVPVDGSTGDGFFRTIIMEVQK